MRRPWTTGRVNWNLISCRWCPNSYQVSECSQRRMRRRCTRRRRHLIRSTLYPIITRRRREASQSTRRGWAKDSTYRSFRCTIIKRILPTITIMTASPGQCKMDRTISQRIVRSRIITRLPSKGHRIQKLWIREGIRFRMLVQEAPAVPVAAILARHLRANRNFMRMTSMI